MLTKCEGEVKTMTDTKPVAAVAAKPEKVPKPVDPHALPHKVKCTRCGGERGVRFIVYSKRVAKVAAERNIALPEVTEASLVTIKDNQNFIKARQINDQTYLCRVCKASDKAKIVAQKAAEKATKVAEKAKVVAPAKK